MGQKDKPDEVTTSAHSQGGVTEGAEQINVSPLTFEIDLGNFKSPMICLLTTERRLTQS